MRPQSLAHAWGLTFVLRCWYRAVNRRQPRKPTAGFRLQPRDSLERESDCRKKGCGPHRRGPAHAIADILFLIQFGEDARCGNSPTTR